MVRPEYRDPAWLVQRAWSVYRLHALQALVADTISGLEGLAPGELLGRDVSTSSPGASEPDPIGEALRACSDELRDACGMTNALAQRTLHCSQVRLHMAQQPAAWSEVFAEALDQYRRAASAALLVRFGRTPTATTAI